MNSDEWFTHIKNMLEIEIQDMFMKHGGADVAAAIKAEAKHNLQVSTANCLRQAATEHFFIIESNHAYHYVANPLGQFFLVQSLNREQAAALLKQKP